MRVLLAISGDNLARWHEAFAIALPDAQIQIVRSDGSPAPPEAVDYLVAWRPSPGLFTQTRIDKAIFNLGAGADALLGIATLPVDVPIFRLEDAGMAEQMAEYVTHAVLRAYRGFDAFATAQAAGHWRRGERLPKETFGIGLLGVGVLGRAVARALLPFGFPLAGFARTPTQVRGVEVYAGPALFERFLAASRVLVCLVPSTPQTRNLLGSATLQKLPHGAHLINIARGDIVVDADLIALLDSGHLGSATLDVFREEPLPPAHPFWHHPRITLTPHISALTLFAESAEQIASKIRAFERGVMPPGRVDPARGY
jgi:glyoxylate/hydroxypyruvate reductase